MRAIGIDTEPPARACSSFSWLSSSSCVFVFAGAISTSMIAMTTSRVACGRMRPGWEAAIHPATPSSVRNVIDAAVSYGSGVAIRSSCAGRERRCASESVGRRDACFAIPPGGYAIKNTIDGQVQRKRNARCSPVQQRRSRSTRMTVPKRSASTKRATTSRPNTIQVCGGAFAAIVNKSRTKREPLLLLLLYAFACEVQRYAGTRKYKVGGLDNTQRLGNARLVARERLLPDFETRLEHRDSAAMYRGKPHADTHSSDASYRSGPSPFSKF